MTPESERITSHTTHTDVCQVPQTVHQSLRTSLETQHTHTDVCCILHQHIRLSTQK